MLIIKSDFSGAYKDISLLNNEQADCNSLKSALESFVSDTHNTGPAYESIKKYFSEYCIPVIQKRIDASEELIKNCTTSCNNFNTYVGSDVKLDDSMIGELEARLSSLNSQISSLDIRIGGVLTEAEARSIAISRAGLRRTFYETDKILKKLEQLKPNNDTATSTIKLCDSTVNAYLSAVNNYSGLSGTLGSYTYNPSANKDEKVDTVDVSDTTNPNDLGNTDTTTFVPNGGNGGAGSPGISPLIDTDTSISDAEIESTPSTSVIAPILAASLIGLTAEDLSKDKSNGVYNVDNYKTGEEWNTKFVNDILNRNSNTKDLLKDYYEDDSYSDPYNDPKSLLKYSQTENSNMNFNWSDSSLDTIIDKSGTIVSKPYVPKEGDVVFFDTENSFDGETANPNRTGMIESVTTTTDSNGVSRTTITVLEGDTKSSNGTGVVSRVTYDLSSEDILGYGSLKTENNITENV